MTHHRRGGYIDRGDGRGWVLDGTPAPDLPAPTPAAPAPAKPPVFGGWLLTPDPEPSAEPDAKPEPKPTRRVSTRTKGK